ncbi:ABC transporter substrate-binding protein [Variovorax paradoxus]|nr:ABC transporter substrate-binding protein [Variovorax paradoxus]
MAPRTETSRRRRVRFKTLWMGSALALLCSSATALTLRVANLGDALSMDPHSSSEGLQMSLLSNIYETLVTRDKQMALAPALATAWEQVTPTVWRFQLRKGVRFHDGSPFTAEDAVFSFERANDPGADLRNTAIKQVRKVAEAAIEIETHEPRPILPDEVTVVFIVSKRWCEENKALKPADLRRGIENSSRFRTNGTGPFRLKERQPAFRTVLARNTNYWDLLESNLDEVVFTPLPHDASRIAALLSGAIDLMEPVPLQQIDRIKAAGGFTVLQGPELRTIFLGMDQKRDELLFSNVKGRNPFKDRRVRQAVYQAIDVETIRSQVMRNAAVPAGLMVAPGIRGFQPDMNARLPHDPAAARRLLAEAGYPKGFEVGMQCPNDRYVNDAAICQAVAAQLARVGIDVSLRTETKSIFQPRLLRRDLSFYLWGFAPGAMDAQIVMEATMATPDGSFRGRTNGGGYSNPRIDELTRRIAAEVDSKQRNEMIREAFRIHQEDVGHIPLHQQALAWAFSDRVAEVVQLPSNYMRFKWISLKSP